MREPQIESGEIVYGHLPRISIVGDIVKRAGTGLGPRTLHDYELLFFPDGTKSVYKVEDSEYVLSEPSFIMTRPGECHEYKYDPAQPSRHLFIHFGYEHNPNMAPPLPLLQKGGPSCIPTSDDLLIGMMKQILNIAYASPDSIERRGGSLLFALLEELNAQSEFQPDERGTEHMPLQIRKAMDYMEKNLSEPITVELLAQQAGWTHEHFSRSFVRYTGRSPREMIIHRRMERACQLLLYEQWSVRDVAYAVGFTDENYFSRVFKNTKGITATEYRKKYYNPWYTELHPVSESDTPYPPNRILYNAGAHRRRKEIKSVQPQIDQGVDSHAL